MKIIPKSIRARLIVVSALLAVVPLLATGILMAQQSISVLTEQEQFIEEETAKNVAGQIAGFFASVETTLRGVADQGVLEAGDPLRVEEALEILLAQTRWFDTLALVDDQGWERNRVSRLDVLGPEDLRQVGDRPEVAVTLRTRTTWFGPIGFDPRTREPTMVISTPVLDLRTGNAEGVLVASTRIKRVWDLIARQTLMPGQQVYLIDAKGDLIAHRNPSLVLRGTRYALPARDDAVIGLGGDRVILATYPVRLGEQVFTVVAERTLPAALELASRLLFTVGAVGLVAFGVSLVVAIAAVRRIVRPLAVLAEVAHDIAAGDLSKVASTRGRNEISELARAFNTMTARLRDTLIDVRSSKARLQSVLDHASAAIFMKDLDGRFALLNRRAVSLLGRPEAEIIGATDFDVFPPDIAERLQDSNRLVLAQGERTEQEMVLTTEGGAHTYLVLKAPMFDETGTIVGLCGIATDITERKESERERLTLARAVEQSPASVIITDPNGNIEYVNPKFVAVTGYGPDEVRGRNPRIFQSGATPVETYQALWGAITSGDTWEGDIQNRKKNGEMFWERASVSPIRSPDGTVLHFLAVKEDITQRKQAEADLLAAWQAADEANRAKTVFLSHMSHELRTPLTAVLGYAEMISLELRGPLPPGYAEDLNAINVGGRQLMSIIDEVLDITRIELGGYCLTLCDTDLAAVCRECVAMLTPQCEAKGIAIEMTRGDPVIRLSDGKAVRQILINLLSNAVKYTPSGGTITVSITVDDGPAVITVADTGCGIPADKLDEVFEPFQRADPRHADPSRGVGLGLAICRRIADLLGCFITVDSDPGRGTRMNVTFPAKDA
ncbi:MAG: PAS domain S-box protein [Phaeospirillum sp.]|nr:PAS domain S-box protein [Phaeospirillum sp.]